jgi:2-dehydro-3-deoxygalactonokinase
VKPAAVIVGDWGTSKLRLFLCTGDGTVLATKAGPGAAAVDRPFPQLLSALLSDWQRGHGELPIVLCGMVGSSFGWTQAPYVPCPASAGQIAAGCVAIEGARVRIVPGLSCTNRLAAPDLMRGEETQILGALQLEPALLKGRRLLCLPGTHTKWAVVNDGVVSDFLTAPTGELYSLLTRHSVLISDARNGQTPATASADDAGFAQGVEQIRQVPAANLLHRLFQCRSRRLVGEMTPAGVSGFLSGLLIASDAQGALRLMAHGTAGSVHIVGAEQLARLYARALAVLGASPEIVDGDAAARAGLMHIHRSHGVSGQCS